MITILIRSILLYLFVLITLRLMGKGELSEMQPFELVILIMISDLATVPMEDTGIPLLHGFISISALLFVQVLVSYLNLKSDTFRSIVCGKPSILIHKGVVDEKELKRLRISMSDLVEQMRLKDYYNLADVEFAILETNGDISIIPKPDKKTVTLEDLNIIPSDTGLPVSLIIDGHVYEDNLKKTSCSLPWLKSELKVQGINNIKDVLFCYMDKDKKLTVQKKDKG